MTDAKFLINNKEILVPQDLDTDIILTGEHVVTEPFLERPTGCTTTISGTLYGQENRDITYQIDLDTSHKNEPDHWNFRAWERVRIPGKHKLVKDLTKSLQSDKTHFYEKNLAIRIETDSSHEVLNKKIRGT